MGIFYLKYRDTLPILEVALLNPDDSAYDLDGSTAWYLNILLSDGTRIQKAMVKEGADADGVLRYQWLAADWNAGGLVVSPDPIVSGTVDHRMEYEVLASGGNRLSFPNTGFDILHITDDAGQGDA